MAVMITESEWQKIKAEHEALKTKMNAILNYVPECWGDDPDPEKFIQSLVVGGTDTPGHAEDCDCWG